MRIYVASSWRSAQQPVVVNELRLCGHDVYDFRNPPGGNRPWKQTGDDLVDAVEYRDAMLSTEAAQDAFEADFTAMITADACVLVLPCGSSAHLEAGWFIGEGRPVCVLLDGPKVTPELMYMLADKIALNVLDVIRWAKNIDMQY